MPHKKPITAIIIFVVIVILVMAAAAYWYFLMGPKTAPQTGTNQNTTQNGFQPIGRNGTGQNGSQNGTSANGNGSTGQGNAANGAMPMPSLRLLSGTPVGGYGASTTAYGTSTIVRWVDRGRGNIYEATYGTSYVTTLSNTVVPKIYGSVWNKNLTSFIGSVLNDDDSTWTGVYAQLLPQAATSSQPDVTPFSLHGKKLPDGVIAYAASPKRDKLFMLVNVNGSGAGYVSSFDGSNAVEIFVTPLTQVNVDWPNDNIITIATKGSASYGGFFYSVNPKTGAWTKILGPIPGLSAVMSHDGKYVLWSETGSGGSGIVTEMRSTAKGTDTDAGARTLADKCAWGNSNVDTVYCAVPSSLASGIYPDAWYTGSALNSDGIWQIDALSGMVKSVSPLVGQADRTIDAFNLGLDPKDSYLFFMDKYDLSLWSLDLSRAQ
jgi:hypothetical protein